MNRKQLKTILLILLATAMLLSFAACRKQGEGDAVESADSTAEPDTQTSEALFFDVLSAGGTACNVYYPDDAEKAVTDAARQIASFVASVTKAKVNATAISRAKGGEESVILVGDTGREESTAFLKTMKYSDYGFSVVSEKVLCVGGASDSGIAKAAKLLCGVLKDSALLTEKTLADGSRESGGKYISSAMNQLEYASYPIGEVTLLSHPLSDFTIVYAEGDEAYAQRLWQRIATVSGYCLPMAPAGGEAQECEILIGNTGRAISDKFYNRNYYRVFAEYQILAEGTQVALAGLNTYTLETALDRFCEDWFPLGVEKDSLNIRASACAKSGKLDSTKINIEQRRSESDIRIVSNNVYFYEFSKERAQLLADSMMTVDADVLLLQEVGAEWHRSLDPMLEQMGYTAVPTKGEGELSGVTATQNYTPVWYRANLLRLIDYGYDQFESVKTRPDGNLSSSKSFTWALLEEKATGKKFAVISTHYTWHASDVTGNKLRTDDATEVMAAVGKIEATYGVPVVVMGDMNCVPNSDPYKVMASGNLKDARYCAAEKFGTTLNTWHKLGEEPGSSGSILDHYFVSTIGLTAKLYQIMKNDYILKTTDHLPLSVDIALT